MTGTLFAFTGIGGKIWSDGINTIATQMRDEFGWKIYIKPWSLWSDLKEFYRTAKGPIVLIGHSAGVTAMNKLVQNGKRDADLGICVDSWFPIDISRKFKNVISIRAGKFGRFDVSGKNVSENIKFPEMTHTSIDNSPKLYKFVRQKMNSLLTGETSKRFYIGAGQQISEADIVRLARANGIPPYLALACAYKETADLEGSYSSGALNALYEDHVAYRNTNGAIRQRLTDNKLAAKGWRDLPYPSSPYPAIDKCVAIAGVEVAALSSSWGMYQLLGENYAMLGFETAADMVAWLAISEINQFLGWIKFIDATNIRHKLIAEDWDGYSLAYNGKAYKSHNYHKKLQALAVKFALKYGKEVGGETPPAPQAATASLPAIEPHKFNIDVDAIKKLAAELKTVGVTINVNINVSYPAENFINPQK